mmetsp:Transcript_40382/g.72530  ORF Transcript_40382/g.72530 Transcript_40382/m.72530 type:complete len:613 (+) Transcript_40382:56-1894(+)|eukprot:CAMPEP_0197660694 /NCGR_PEP_ID=MMETSP1338-20131121/51005_1 /TAXON_ID=43686 ORGANISM="Pelagodinium beii, Strain RCC1491" /NCGR_SAMPLE_ID=MMETSP1338 /ASSEMBLY_ACC=CAM_ASM_000754 /LENGTH=612 /DNA_ID=CAMNT_0043238105 /DNA_START=56 /DNA_END=1894 /DNA_ORIENTATION=+
MPRPRISVAAAAAFRDGSDDLVLQMETPRSQKSQGGIARAKSTPLAIEEVVEVWLAGEWKSLPPAESLEILACKKADVQKFDVAGRGTEYSIDLGHMTRTSISTGRCRKIRILDKFATMELGFDEFREAFWQRASTTGGKHLTAEALMSSWPYDGDDLELLTHTVHDTLRKMVLRAIPHIDMTEWIHYWALERDGASASAIAEVNSQLQKALRHDPQVLERLQNHFEAVAKPVAGGSSSLGLSRDGLVQVCKRIVASPQDVKEKQWAQELLAMSGSEDVVEEDEELSYHDYLNVMLGRKRYKVYLWMYDISHGFAERWSWLVLGKEHRGFWHTGLVVEWPDRKSEFWFGGKIFDSVPGTSPFGEPVEKRFLGFTYKRQKEVRHWLIHNVVDKFTKTTYDVRTHNCNHFSDMLSMHLRNEHIPEEIVRQSEMIMETPAAKVLQPVLNRWLGGFEAKDGQAPTSFEHENLDGLGVMALVEFSKEEGGRLFVGRVEDMQKKDVCTITALDFWRQCPVELDVNKEQIAKVLVPGLQSGRSIPSLAHMVRNSTRFEGRSQCAGCWFPSFAACLESNVECKRQESRKISRQSGHEMRLCDAGDDGAGIAKEVTMLVEI